MIYRNAQTGMQKESSNINNAQLPCCWRWLVTLAVKPVLRFLSIAQNNGISSFGGDPSWSLWMYKHWSQERNRAIVKSGMASYLSWLRCWVSEDMSGCWGCRALQGSFGKPCKIKGTGSGADIFLLPFGSIFWSELTPVVRVGVFWETAR